MPPTSRTGHHPLFGTSSAGTRAARPVPTLGTGHSEQPPSLLTCNLFGAGTGNLSGPGRLSPPLRVQERAAPVSCERPREHDLSQRRRETPVSRVSGAVEFQRPTGPWTVRKPVHSSPDEAVAFPDPTPPSVLIRRRSAGIADAFRKANTTLEQFPPSAPAHRRSSTRKALGLSRCLALARTP